MKNKIMKSKKIMAAAAAMAMLAASAGCEAAGTEPTEVPAIHVGESEQAQESGVLRENTQTEENVPEDSTQPEKFRQPEEEQDYLSGKVREIGDNSVIISKTFIEDDGQSGSLVYIPEKGSADEELVTIRFTDDTEFEYWTIKGGGAGIERREGSFSDISVDTGLEAYGYYEGGVFAAQRAIIEIDV